jgi:tetratricopeptide (TPR) repeat protein
MPPGKGGVLLLEWLFAIIVGGAFVVRVVHALFEREIEVWQGLVGICFGAGLTVMAISLALSPWYFPSLALIFLIAVTVYLGSLIEMRVRWRRLLAEEEARYLEAIRFDEKNAAAHGYLARVYRQQGRLEDALDQYQQAIALDPNDLEWPAKLKVLMAQIEEIQASPPCPRCEAPLDAAGKTCPKCGWWRSAVKGLRDVWASGAVKRGLVYGLVICAAVGVLARILGASVALTLTFVLVSCLAGVVLYCWWLLRELV